MNVSMRAMVQHELPVGTFLKEISIAAFCGRPPGVVDRVPLPNGTRSLRLFAASIALKHIRLRLVLIDSDVMGSEYLAQLELTIWNARKLLLGVNVRSTSAPNFGELQPVSGIGMCKWVVSVEQISQFLPGICTAVKPDEILAYRQAEEKLLFHFSDKSSDFLSVCWGRLGSMGAVFLASGANILPWINSNPCDSQIEFPGNPGQLSGWPPPGYAARAIALEARDGSGCEGVKFVRSEVATVQSIALMESTDTLLHEFGHVFGLRHCNNITDNLMQQGTISSHMYDWQRNAFVAGSNVQGFSSGK